jgi:hypothetical protein
MKRYKGERWRILEDGSEDGHRVLTRQVIEDDEQYLQIARDDGLMWRRATEADTFRKPPQRLPQVETDWVA